MPQSMLRSSWGKPIPAPLKRLLSSFSYFGSQVCRLSARRCGVALTYHRVGDPQGDPGRELVPAIGTKLFEAQLKHLKRCYRVVPASQLFDAVLKRRRGEKFPIALTFDDDLPSHARIAMPRLQQLRLPATFFISGASLTKPSAFWWEYLQAAVDTGRVNDALLQLARSEEPTSRSTSSQERDAIHDIAERIQLMPPQERDALTQSLRVSIGSALTDFGMPRKDVAALADASFEIGFHTLRHDLLPPLDDSALVHAMKKGRAEVAAVVGRELTTIAYPHGEADARVANAARAAGYTSGFTISPEPVRPTTDPLLQGRLPPTFASGRYLALQVLRSLVKGPYR